MRSLENHKQLPAFGYWLHDPGNVVPPEVNPLPLSSGQGQTETGSGRPALGRTGSKGLLPRSGNC